MIIEHKIVGQGIYLLCLTEADASDRYLSWLRDSRVNKYLESRFYLPQSKEEIRQFIASVNQSRNEILFGIFTEKHNRHIGNIKIGPISLDHLTAEIGYLIGEPSEWGRGYATTAIAITTAYAINRLGIRKVTAGCYASNIGSQKALLRAGFKEEGREVQQYLIDGNAEDGLRYGYIARANSC